MSLVSLAPLKLAPLTLAIVTFLFILVCVLCTFAVIPGVYRFYCPFKKKRCTPLPKGTEVHIQQHIHEKDLHLCLPLNYYGKFFVKLEKAQTRNSIVFIVLIVMSLS